MALTITFEDEDANIYTLPSDFAVKEVNPWPIKIRSDVSARAFADGGVETGDQKIDKRKLKITGKIHSETYGNTLSALLKELIKKDLKLRYTTNQRFANIRIRSFEVKKLLGTEDSPHGMFAEAFTIKCEMLDPYYHGNVDVAPAATTITDVNTGVITPATFSVINTGDMDALPIIQFDASTSLANINLKNVTDNSLTMFYLDGGILSGDEIVINSVDGVVTKNEANNINFFFGNFLKLVTGTNNFEFLSSATGTFAGLSNTISFTFSTRYLQAEGTP